VFIVSLVLARALELQQEQSVPQRLCCSRGFVCCFYFLHDHQLDDRQQGGRMSQQFVLSSDICRMQFRVCVVPQSIIVASMQVLLAHRIMLGSSHFDTLTAL
jgi:hypothetical protein